MGGYDSHHPPIRRGALRAPAGVEEGSGRTPCAPTKNQGGHAALPLRAEEGIVITRGMAP
jgi:hypothetical protein